ncbi:MAG: hypothetical protein KatS3mg087_1192 [Patescibacteria group bacterium]|nr:MAG: hypothetical protein KatS3mg087_1192 [Patescibacteria group bacterium]
MPLKLRNKALLAAAKIAFVYRNFNLSPDFVDWLAPKVESLFYEGKDQQEIELAIREHVKRHVLRTRFAGIDWRKLLEIFIKYVLPILISVLLADKKDAGDEKLS